MDIPSAPQSTHETPEARTPWGLFIGLILILAIIVAGAYYSLNSRIHNSSHKTPAATILNVYS